MEGPSIAAARCRISFLKVGFSVHASVERGYSFFELRTTVLQRSAIQPPFCICTIQGSHTASP
jgi:hypothetical protein